MNSWTVFACIVSLDETFGSDIDCPVHRSHVGFEILKSVFFSYTAKRSNPILNAPPVR